MRLLVTGATGLLGAAIVARARARGHSLAATALGAAHVAGVRVDPVDLLDATAARKAVDASRADAVVHAAAWTDVDACERDPDAARRMNADVPEVLAGAAARRGARFLHVSTDAVVAGAGPAAAEDAAPAPPNVYARTKFEAERRVRTVCPRALVVRTNFFGLGSRSGRGLAAWALSEWRAGRAVTGFEDVRFNPLWAGHAAGILLDLLGAEAQGILHVASREAVTKHEFLRRLAAAFGVDPALVRRGMSTAAGLAAPRASSTVLAVGRVEGILSRPMPDLAEGLAAFVQATSAGGPGSEKGGRGHVDR